MEHIIVAIIIISIVTAICLILVFVGNNHKRKSKEKLLVSFKQLASENNLSFTSQELLQNSLIGFDGIRKKLLYIQDEDGKQSWFIINLDDISSSGLKIKHRPMNAGFTKGNADEYIEKVALEFYARDGKTIEIPFYQQLKNDISQKKTLEQKARHWETILSKMISKEEMRIA